MKLSNFNLVKVIIEEIQLCQMFLKYDMEFCLISDIKYKNPKETNEDKELIRKHYNNKIKELYNELRDMGVEVDISVNQLHQVKRL